MSTWNPPSPPPAMPGEYYRNSGSAVDYAYWDGMHWYHIQRKQSGAKTMQKPHRDQTRPWRTSTPRGSDALPVPGERFGRLTFVKDVGYDDARHRWLAVFHCDCGNEKAMNLYEVRSGVIEACGCRRTEPAVIERQRNGQIKWHRENAALVAATNKELGKGRTGQEKPIGPGAKWSLNVHSKYWEIVSPEGVSVCGWNLSQLIRDNAGMFSHDDLVWRKGMCKASKGLRSLFEIKNGKPKSKAWKGWKAMKKGKGK